MSAMTTRGGNKIAWLAWILCGMIAVLALFNLVTTLTNREYGQGIVQIIGDIAWILVPAEFALLACLIISHQPRNVIGWLVMLPAISLAADANFQAYFNSFSAPPPAPSAAFLLGLWFFGGWSWMLFIFPIFFILLLFPTGQPLSPRWRWVSYYILGVCAISFTILAFNEGLSPQNGAWSLKNPIGFVSFDWTEKYSVFLFEVGILSSTLLGLIAMFLRFRRARSVEREQIKWILYACSWFGAAYLLANFSNISSQVWSAGSGLVNFLWSLSVMSIPAAIAIAILRYRLWDIDVIIRRTLIYGGLSVTLAAVYFGSVVLLQALFQRVAGGQSTIAIVLSTLLIAALFNPLRRRIQRDIDRRFYRRKYDAQRTLEAFGASLRDQVELEQLSGQLLAVVQETMQPASVSLWLKPQAEKKKRITNA